MFYQEKMGKSNMLARIPENLPRYYHIIYEIVQCFRENLFTAGVIPFTNLNVFSPIIFLLCSKLFLEQSKLRKKHQQFNFVPGMIIGWA